MYDQLLLWRIEIETQTIAANRKSSLKPSTIRIGRRYRANRLSVNYDAVVIGSGIGGLTTAAL